MSYRTRINTIQTLYNQQIERVAHDFGDHEGVRVPKITRWVANFEDVDFPLALKILQNITYYSSENIRNHVHNLVGLCYTHFSEFRPDRILFVPIGSSYEGSSVVARALRDELGDEERILDLLDLNRLRQGSFDALVFLDDFSGTGNTLRNWWTNVEPLVLPWRVPFVIALMVLNQPARQVIEQFSPVLCIDELSERHDVFSTHSAFTNPEKNRITDYCDRTGCSNRFRRGFGDCGLLVAFKHQCPNNSLPVLWFSSEEVPWEALFRRSGL